MTEAETDGAALETERRARLEESRVQKLKRTRTRILSEVPEL